MIRALNRRVVIVAVVLLVGVIVAGGCRSSKSTPTQESPLSPIVPSPVIPTRPPKIDPELMTAIEKGQKAAPDDFVFGPNGWIDCIVRLDPDKIVVTSEHSIKEQSGGQLIIRHGGQVIDGIGLTNSIGALMPLENIKELAQEDAVISIIPNRIVETDRPVKVTTATPSLTLAQSRLPASSPTRTPFVTQDGRVVASGYTFGLPELILTHDRIKVVNWLPGINEELIVRDSEDDRFLIETLNVETGQRQRLVETGKSIIGDPVWLPASQQIAYLAWDEAGESINLYLSDFGTPDVAMMALSDVRPPVVPAPSGAGLLVWDSQMRQLLDTSQGKVTLLSLEEPLPAVKGGPFPYYQAAWSEQTDWIAVYHPAKSVLINPQTGEVQGIELGKAPADWGVFGAVQAVWSPDGQKLAMIVAPRGYAISGPVPFTQLGVFNPDTGEMQLIPIADTLTYVTDIAWAPDSRQLLISVAVESSEGPNTETLSLVDTEAGSMSPVPIMPDGAFKGASFSRLAWSPDGKRVVIGYAEQPGYLGWYRVLVETP